MNKIFLLIFLTLSLVFCENDLQMQNDNEISQLSRQQQLEQEKQNLEQQKSILETLKNQQFQQSQQIGVLYPSQLTSYNLQIQNLTDVLQNLKTTERDITQTATAILQEQNSAAQLARDQIDPLIASLEQNILQTQEQIYVWTNNIFPLTSSQQQLYENLKNLLESQKQQLAILREQKLNISAEVLRQTRLVNSASQQQKSELVESQTAIQDEIFSLRAEIERLQATYSQARMNYAPLSQQISQAQKNYDEQFKKVKALEEATTTTAK